jgi:hypothetical protein
MGWLWRGKVITRNDTRQTSGMLEVLDAGLPTSTPTAPGHADRVPVHHEYWGAAQLRI